MALLTLKAEQIPCHWPTIEDKLARWPHDLKIVSQKKDTRTYSLNPSDLSQPISLLKELQAHLADSEIHFFVDLRS